MWYSNWRQLLESAVDFLRSVLGVTSRLKALKAGRHLAALGGTQPELEPISRRRY